MRFNVLFTRKPKDMKKIWNYDRNFNLWRKSHGKIITKVHSQSSNSLKIENFLTPLKTKQKWMMMKKNSTENEKVHHREILQYPFIHSFIISMTEFSLEKTFLIFLLSFLCGLEKKIWNENWLHHLSSLSSFFIEL